MKTVFIQPDRCIGCKQCEAACAVAHSQSKNVFFAALEEPRPVPRIHAEPGLTLGSAFPNKCQHCNPAPCQQVCPTRAIFRPADRADLVLLEPRRCIACGMCAMACPFDVITYYPSAAAPDRERVATKCDGCVDRQREGLEPACVEACKVDALVFADANEMLRLARHQQALVQARAAAQASGDMEPETPTYEAFKAWGAAVTRLNAGATQGA